MDPNMAMVQALLAKQSGQGMPGAEDPALGQQQMQPQSPSMMTTPPPGMSRMPPGAPMGGTATGNGLPPGVPMDGTGQGSSFGAPVPMPMQEPYVLTPEEQAQWQKFLGSQER